MINAPVVTATTRPKTIVRRKAICRADGLGDLRAMSSTMCATPISPKKPLKPKQRCHPGSGMKPRKARNPSAERLASWKARREVNVRPNIFPMSHAHPESGDCHAASGLATEGAATVSTCVRNSAAVW